ncbi:MAG: hypothetical protein SFY32_05825 [Bacteroidota bacterium]|nr:hypothetical protein [Bacteroidota bacterium]
MNIHIQHITDPQGVAQFVQIPVNEFDKLFNEYKKLKQIVQIEKKIKNSLKQSKLIDQGSIKEKSLKDFLNEC